MKAEINTPKAHHGRNVKHLREMLGVKQETIAEELGITQQAMSKIELKEEIEDQLLGKIADILNIPVQAIKNLSESATYNYINTFNDESSADFMSNPYQPNIKCTFNPIDKIVELYERMLKTEQEKVAMMEQMLKEKK